MAITTKDPGGVLKDVHDEANQRLRVDVGAAEVTITDLDDSIKIGDGSGTYLDINPDGSINVNVADAVGQEETIAYGEVSGIASGVESIVITYTVPILTTSHIHFVNFSGSNIAVYRVKINGTTVAKHRTWWTNFNGGFNFLSNQNKGVELSAGDILTVTVLHNSASVGEFNASVRMLEVS